MGKTLFVLDIDGTLADASKRYKKAGKEPSRKNKRVYDSWIKRVQNERLLLADKPVAGMLRFVNSLPSADIRYITSREHKWAHTTRKWLNSTGFNFAHMHHRNDGDYRSAGKVKEDKIKLTLSCYPEYTSVVVVDDDPKGDIEKMCHKNGYTFLKAKSGS